MQINPDERLILRFCSYLRRSKTNLKDERWSKLNNGFKREKARRRSIFLMNIWLHTPLMTRLGIYEERPITKWERPGWPSTTTWRPLPSIRRVPHNKPTTWLFAFLTSTTRICTTSKEEGVNC